MSYQDRDSILAEPQGLGDWDPRKPNSALVVLLHSLADTRVSKVRDGFARGEWSRCSWHMNAPWAKDEEILNRVWIASASKPVVEGSPL